MLVTWNCVYDQIVYIVKKGINFFKKGVLMGGGTKFFLRAYVRKMCPPPPTQMLSYGPVTPRSNKCTSKMSTFQLNTLFCFYISTLQFK